MNPEDFSNSPSGKTIQTRQGYWAYVPNTLPPPIEYNGTVVQLISEAERALGELSGAGSLLPNPNILISPYIRREAVSSSRIEGTQASLSDLFFFEASGAEESPRSDVQEVQNYVRAIDYGLERLKELPLSIPLLCEIHGILFKGLKGEDNPPGEVRRRQNWIGPPGRSLYEATFVPPPVEELKPVLDALDQYLQSRPITASGGIAPQRLRRDPAQGGEGALTEPSLIQCALVHYQFEVAHPFTDGNGRIGRLLVTFFLREKGLLGQPILYLSEFFDKYKDEYYQKLLGVSQKGAWPGWFEFFLRGVAHQARAALADARKIIELHAEYQTGLGRTKKIPGAAQRLIEEIFFNPVISVAGLSRKWSLPFNSVKKGVQRLVEIGILKESTGKKRDRLFVAPKLMKLLTSQET